MVKLGVGKNMVRSIRFWVEVMGVAVPDGKRALEVTSFASAIFSEGGFDPYLEDLKTLWLLHWHLSTHSDDPVFAWRYLINHWPHSDLRKNEILKAFRRESENSGNAYSDVTLAQHLDVFLHTYVPSRSRNAQEDSIDGPLVDLEFLQHAGETHEDRSGIRDAVYQFRREPKPEISRELFEYCVHDFWQQWRPGETALTFNDLTTAPCSVGQVLKLPEDDIRARLDCYVTRESRAWFVYQPSAIQGFLTKNRMCPERSVELLKFIYEPTAQNA